MQKVLLKNRMVMSNVGTNFSGKVDIGFSEVTQTKGREILDSTEHVRHHRSDVLNGVFCL